jgi:hypothetical protein
MFNRSNYLTVVGQIVEDDWTECRRPADDELTPGVIGDLPKQV